MNSQRAIRLTTLLDEKRNGKRMVADVLMEAKTLRANAFPASVMKDMRSGDTARACAQVLDLALDGIRHASRRDGNGKLDAAALKAVLLDAEAGLMVVLMDAFRNGAAGRSGAEWLEFSGKAMGEVIEGAERMLFLHGEDRVEVSRLAAPEIRMVRAVWKIAERGAIEEMGAECACPQNSKQ